MIFNLLKLLAISTVWILKCFTSLPKLYHSISKKRGIPVSLFRKNERLGLKVVKLKLDVNYFETCLDLKICPRFLKFKPPNLSVYKKPDYLFQSVLSKKLKETNRELRIAESRFRSVKQQILSEVTFIEKQCLIALLTRFFKSSAQQILAIHNKKLINLWKKERIRCPESVTNLSSKKLDIKQKEALRFGLNHHILPKKI